MDLIVTCRPSSTGQFSGTASFGTNSGLPAFEAGGAVKPGYPYDSKFKLDSGYLLLLVERGPGSCTVLEERNWEKGP